MTYTKLPDEQLTDPKIAGLSDRAFRLYVNGLVYSNLRLTDGYVPDADGVLGLLVPNASPKVIKAAVKELRAAQLWDWKPPSGYYIVDFTKHQLTKNQLKARREQKRDAALQRWYPEGVTDTDAHASAMQTHSESTASANASAMPVPRTPYPVPGSSKKNGAPDAGMGRASAIGAALERVRQA